MHSFSTLMGKQTLLPIIQASTVSQGVETAKAMVAAGIQLVEVVLRTDVSLDVINTLKKELPELQKAINDAYRKNDWRSREEVPG